VECAVLQGGWVGREREDPQGVAVCRVQMVPRDLKVAPATTGTQAPWVPKAETATPAPLACQDPRACAVQLV